MSPFILPVVVRRVLLLGGLTAVVALLVCAAGRTLAQQPAVALAPDQSFARPARITASLTATVYSWAKTWGGASTDSAHAVAVDGLGNVYVAGEFAGAVDFDPGADVVAFTANGSADVFLSKFDAGGNFRWVRTWGGAGRDVPNGLGVDMAGNVYVSGPFQNTVDFDPSSSAVLTGASNAGSMNNMFLSKFDPAGNLVWAKTWGPSDGGSESYSLAVDGSNHIYVEGDFTGSTVDLNPDPVLTDMHTNHPGPLANFDSFLSKFDSDGNFVWARTWGGEGYDDGTGVAVDGQGNVYVAGMYGSKDINFDPAGGDLGTGHPAHDSGFIVDAFLSKFDADGVFKWVQTWGAQGTDEAGMIVVAGSSNDEYVAGRFTSASCDFNPGAGVENHSSHGNHDAFVSKFDSAGNFGWARTWGGAGWDAPSSLALDGANNLYMAGFFSDVVDFDPAANTTDVRASNGMRDLFLSGFDPNGNFLFAKTWGGSGEDWSYHVRLDESRRAIYQVGFFSNRIDFDPAAGIDGRDSNGMTDAFMSKFWSPSFVYLPLVAACN